MSELKVYVHPLKTNILSQTIVGQSYYLKSEADKVIADLIEKNERLSDECLIKASNTFREIEKEIRHHKYKRCLAMAKVCYLRFVRYENYLQKLCASNATIAAYKFRRDMYDKWEKRWRELAQKFKPNKEAK